MAESGMIGPNLDRQARVEELKVLIIEYFRRERNRMKQEGTTSGAGGSVGDRIRNTMREMLGLEPGQRPLDDLLDRLPEPPDEQGLLRLS